MRNRLSHEAIAYLQSLTMDVGFGKNRLSARNRLYQLKKSFIAMGKSFISESQINNGNRL